MAKQRTDTEAVLKLVINNEQAKTSAKELQDAYRKLTAELGNMKKADDPKAYADKAKNVTLLKKTLNELKNEQAGVTQENKKFEMSWQSIKTGMLAGFGIGAAIGFLKGLGTEVFNTIAKFQKMEAVLTTTLGSRSQAVMVMQQISDFASKTPFQVDELTDAFVKLANQGFRPNIEQMRSLGDLAASTGKDFDMLAEAIIDAQTGEFERLKSFGIRASKQGDIVKFTFKGVTEEVNFSAEAIRNYITELGNLEGVAGSTAAISATLGGELSNLSDNWTLLLKAVGEGSNDIFSSTLGILNTVLEKVRFFKEDMNVVDKYNLKSDFGLTFENGGLTLKDVSGQSEQVNTIRKQIADYVSEISKGTPSVELFNAALTTLQKDSEKSQKTVKDKNLSKAIADQYAMGIDAVNGLRKKSMEDQLNAEENANSKAREVKKAADEKARLKAVSDAKQKADALTREYDGLKKLSAQMEEDFKISNLDGLDKKLAEIDAKYDPLIEKAKRFKNEALVGLLSKIKKGEGLNAEEVAFEEDQKKNEKNRKDKFQEAQDLLNSKFDGKSVDNVNAATSDEDLAAREYALEEERLIAFKLLYETYGEDSVQFEKSLADRKLAERQRLNDGHKELTDSQIKTEEAVNEAMNVGISLLKGMVDSTSGLYKTLLVVEKAMAISKIIVNTQAEISGYYAKYSLVPGGVAIASGLAMQAKIRAGISIGVVAATGIAEAVGSGKKGKSNGKKKYAIGGIPNGPSHAQGGIKLVDGITGAIIGEMEGGERILSKSDTALVDNMIYGGQRQMSKTMSINAAGVLDAERVLRYGTGVSGSAGGSNTNTVNNNTTQISTAALEEKMERFISAAENAWNYRFFEQKKKLYDDIKSDLNS